MLDLALICDTVQMEPRLCPLHSIHVSFICSFQGLRPGGIVVDMTTSEPALAEEIAAAAAAVGVASVDAPVSG